ncbi:hypothetical protein TanjilG_06298 [Lupinus angustifolius]|uniref:Fe2OG dioxygenase domain-containing protein n=1 Tax=Lupinus angustifolius TaxID=3871 RepID=A0A1J7ID73_LUPAN|nr:PREDICTED: gibberellin 2-beta-dioxygenase 8-like [Lupinus angustifolius]OIW12093.1 hypothetical protein TanjilG_06298 [Lupinus angustifolius]
MDFEPPLLESYKTLLQSSLGFGVGTGDVRNDDKSSMVVEICELPLIDLNLKREEFMKEIIEAARDWGFFQVVNHGIPQEVLQKLKFEQKKVFQRPFSNKSQGNFLNLPVTCYRWGNSFAKNLRQTNWSEALHIFLHDIGKVYQEESLRSTMDAFATAVSPLVENLVQILAQKLNVPLSYFKENCSEKSCSVRLNRYPPCPLPSKVYGLMPHTDTSFITILQQDQAGGLQLMKDGQWVDVKPVTEALVVNIGDLFQALSNGFYKSVKHRVVAMEKVERLSAAYFYNPSPDAVIQSYGTPPLYKKFTFGEMAKLKQKDVMETGDKVGLSWFLCTPS